MNDNVKVVAGLSGLAIVLAVSLAPTVGVIWLIFHFARKFW